MKRMRPFPWRAVAIGDGQVDVLDADEKYVVQGNTELPLAVWEEICRSMNGGDEDDDLERRMSFAHYGAQAAAWEQVKGWLMKKAQDQFSVGQDDKAKMLRDLSREAETEGRELRAKQKEYE